jgi:hypothetical protein
MGWYCTVFFKREKKKGEGSEGDFSMRSLRLLSRNDKVGVVGMRRKEERNEALTSVIPTEGAKRRSGGISRCRGIN